MRSLRAVTLLAVVGTVLAGSVACGSKGSGAGDEWPSGRTFLSTSVTDGGAARPLVKGSRIELTFTPEATINARAGCNHMSGSASVDDGHLVVTELGTTEMGCEQALMDQDTWLSGVLTARPELGLTGDELTIRAGTVEVRLTDSRVADPDRPLVGTRWVVDTIISGAAASSVPNGVAAYLTFSAAGTFEGSSGCGRISGDARVTDRTIVFSSVEGLASTCDAASVLVAAMKTTVNGEVTYDIERRRLTLTGPGGAGLGLIA